MYYIERWKPKLDYKVEFCFENSVAPKPGQVIRLQQDIQPPTEILEPQHTPILNLSISFMRFALSQKTLIVRILPCPSFAIFGFVLRLSVKFNSFFEFRNHFGLIAECRLEDGFKLRFHLGYGFRPGLPTFRIVH